MNTFNIVNSILTLIVAIVVCVVIVMQYKNERRNLRLVLYDKRFQAFHKTKTFINKVISQPTDVIGTLGEYHPVLDEISFLFDTDIRDFTGSLRDKALEIGSFYTMYFTIDDPTKVSEDSVNENDDAIKWFVDANNAIAEKFFPYLDFRKI